MKRVLIASASCIWISAGIPLQARAQGVPVIDVASIAQTVANQVETITHMVQEYSILKQQYSEMVSTYNALSHGNNVLSVAPGLLTQAAQLPGSLANIMPGLAFGSTVSGSGSQFLNQNHYYTPTGSDFAAQEIQRKQNATANIQGEAMVGMQRADLRTADLQQLQSNIQAQPDVTSLAASAAHINAEQTFLGNEATNVQRLQLLAAMQDRVDSQRAEESGRQDADQWHAYAAAAAFGE